MGWGGIEKNQGGGGLQFFPPREVLIVIKEIIAALSR